MHDRPRLALDLPLRVLGVWDPDNLDRDPVLKAALPDRSNVKE